VPILLLSRLETVDNYLVVKIPDSIRKSYPYVFSALDNGHQVRVRVYVGRFFNRDGDVVKEYKRLFSLLVTRGYIEYYIDFTYFHVKDGIPVEYFVEALITGFIVTFKEGRPIETPAFPNEFIVEEGFGVPGKVKSIVKAEERALERVGRDVEVIGLLYAVGLQDVATDLVEALTRFYTTDYEGSIKFFRKVVEGLRNYIREKDIPGMGKNRQELLEGFASKAFQLISNFGEHAGTYGSMHEATLSKDIALTLSRYLASYIRRG